MKKKLFHKKKKMHRDPVAFVPALPIGARCTDRKFSNESIRKRKSIYNATVYCYPVIIMNGKIKLNNPFS